MTRRLRAAAALAALVIAAPLVVNASASPRYTGFCDSFLSFLCPKDDEQTEETPTPDPGATDAPETPEEDAEVPADPETETPDAEEADPVEAPADDAAPVFSGIPAAMRSGGLSFTGLHSISIVSVPTADGGSVRALKITADSITITDFALTVRPPDSPGLVTNADTMALTGNVAVYLGSISASSMGGDPLTIGTDTPPPLDDVEPGLLDVTMGLIGSTADVITYTNTDQRIVE